MVRRTNVTVDAVAALAEIPAQVAHTVLDSPYSLSRQSTGVSNGDLSEGPDETRVVDDPTVTHVEAMMDIAAARSDEMRSQWRLFSLP
jgi:hypothetical protein